MSRINDHMRKTFFFFWKRNCHSFTNKERNYNKESKRSSKKTKLMGGLGKAGSGAVVHGSFPDLSNTCRFSKLGELMGCSIMIPFQMMEAPAAEI